MGLTSENTRVNNTGKAKVFVFSSLKLSYCFFLGELNGFANEVLLLRSIKYK